MEMNLSRAYALEADANDPLAEYRNLFLIPRHHNEPVAYFCGNSLGLQPLQTAGYLKEELDQWAEHGVEGHFQGARPWFHYHKFLTEPAARLVGAKPSEVVVMNNLTVNLHLLMVSFYRPVPGRFKILMEAAAFPSDMYAVESQVRFHGYNPDEAIIELKPREGAHSLQPEDILDAIREHGSSLALVFFSGVQYYTGQAFDIRAITEVAHEQGAMAGFDLAHAAGNLKLSLHEWDVDFAAWCSYKYLNSGPGGVSGVFIHERHGLNPGTPRFAGWWGHKEDERFLMQKGYIPEPGAAGWQLSNAPVLSMAAHLASLELFDRAGMDALWQKSLRLTAFLEFTLLESARENKRLSFNIITPPPPHRGAQISVLCGPEGRALFHHLSEQGVVADWREPDVIRLAPVPMYNSFDDIYRLGAALRSFA
ncbi:MAG: kynureninase [Bacteroidetes bacterium]|nr:kynureninase [Bacteroidota bacterium]